MVLSGFYRPKWSDIYKGATVLAVVAAGAQILNYTFEGSNADYMTLRYGNGNPFAFLLHGDTPILYYLLLTVVAVGGTALVLIVTILIQKLVDKKRKSTVK